MKLTTAEDLAEQFGLTLRRFHEMRRLYSWPSVRFGKNEFRFTDAQVEQIVAMQSSAPKKVKAAPAKTVIDGQTQRSARRSA